MASKHRINGENLELEHEWPASPNGTVPTIYRHTFISDKTRRNEKKRDLILKEKPQKRYFKRDLTLRWYTPLEAYFFA